MKKAPICTSGFLAAAIMATVLSFPASARAAGSVEDLKSDSVPVPTAEAAAEERAARTGRMVFDEFSIIGDPLYRQGSIELLKKAVKKGKEAEKTEIKEAAPAAPAVKDALPASSVKKAVPSKSRPADLRDAPSDRVRTAPAPKLKKAPAPKALPVDPVAPRKAS